MKEYSADEVVKSIFTSITVGKWETAPKRRRTLHPTVTLRDNVQIYFPSPSVVPSRFSIEYGYGNVFDQGWWRYR